MQITCKNCGRPIHPSGGAMYLWNHDDPQATCLHPSPVSWEMEHLGKPYSSPVEKVREMNGLFIVRKYS